MGVALKASLGVTVGLVVASQVPDDQGLVATGGKEHVGAIDDAIAISKTLFQIFEISPVISYFSREVAKLVTQPLWPSRVPRRMSCSAMIKVWRQKKNLETGEKGGERRLTGYLYRLGLQFLSKKDE